ncbi:MAG: SnoaL-like domain-containing protein [Ferruginibacter sp.]
MTTKEIAGRLVELCNKGEFETAQKELFAQDAVSIEAHETPAFAKETKGLDQIVEKGRRFEEMTEKMHSISVSAPIIGGNSFAVIMTLDITMKGQERMNMSELCVYETRDGKVISEQFHM